MLSVLTLYDLHHLHRHVRLFQDTSWKRKHPEIPRVAVADRQEKVCYIHQPVSVFCVQFLIVPAVENLLRKAGYLPSLEVVWVKKLADA